MASNLSDQTSQAGDGESQTSESGTVQDSTQTQSSELTHPALEERLRTVEEKFSNSARESQRLYQENLRLTQENQRLAQQPPPSQARVEAPQVSEDVFSPEEAAAYSDAILDKNAREIQRLERIRTARISEKSEANVLAKLGGMATTQQRTQASFSYISTKFPELSDPKSAFYQKTFARYNQMVHDPMYSHIDATEVPAGNGAMLKPHLLREAALETKAEMGANRNGAEDAARQSAEYFVEPSSKATVQKKPEFSEKLLFPEEKSYVEKMHRRDPAFTPKRYFDGLEPEVKEARMKAQKPIRKGQV